MAHVSWAAVNEAGLTPMQEAARRLEFIREAAGTRLEALDIESSPYWSEVTEDVDAALVQRAAASCATPIQRCCATIRTF